MHLQQLFAVEPAATREFNPLPIGSGVGGQMNHVKEGSSSADSEPKGFACRVTVF